MKTVSVLSQGGKGKVGNIVASNGGQGTTIYKAWQPDVKLSQEQNSINARNKFKMIALLASSFAAAVKGLSLGTIGARLFNYRQRKKTASNYPDFVKANNNDSAITEVAAGTNEFETLSENLSISKGSLSPLDPKFTAFGTRTGETVTFTVDYDAIPAEFKKPEYVLVLAAVDAKENTTLAQNVVAFSGGEVVKFKAGKEMNGTGVETYTFTSTQPLLSFYVTYYDSVSKKWADSAFALTQ